MVEIFIPITSLPKPLNDEKLWEIDEMVLLNETVINLIKELKFIIPQYINAGYTIDLSETNVSVKLIKRVTYWLCDDINIIDAILKASTLRSDLGYIIGQYKVKLYNIRNNQIPVGDDFKSLSGAIRKGKWKQFNISTWQEFMYLVFGVGKNKEYGYFKGKEGLENAKNDALTFYKENGRLPKTTDLITIKTKITEGNWVDYGINTWNDFLKMVFNEVNVEKYDYSKYRGKKGLDYAVNEVQQFKLTHKKNPRIKDFPQINEIITRGEWKEFGIPSWNSFLKLSINEINMQHNKYHRYQGRMGLKLASKEAKLFKEENDRLPKRRDRRSWDQAIRNGYWQEFGISKFNDFLQYVFGEINMKGNGYYKGKIGLNRAIKEGIAVYHKKGKLPTKRDLRTIYSLITDRGYWSELGIRNWADYKDHVNNSESKIRDL